MHDLVDAFFASNSYLRFRALGVRENLPGIDLEPFGHAAEFLDARAYRYWVERYYQANRIAFAPKIGQEDTALPRWVLCDLYLMPTVIGLLTCPSRFLSDDQRTPWASPEDEDVAAAFVAVPSLLSGTVVGVSLLSRVHGIGAGAIVKALTLKMLRARKQRGITQWANKSIRHDHTRMGIMHVEGRAVGHGVEGSFVYRIDLHDEEVWRQAMDRTLIPHQGPMPARAEWIPISDRARLHSMLEQAERGDTVKILPPGLSDDHGSLLVLCRKSAEVRDG